uniref:Uncharacterized protein n=1 Tax=Piliocolobus tephrosceles TaxID=591936 RepID=A0A8C9LYB8_9PRIM
MRTTQKRRAPMIQLPPTRSLPEHMGIVGAVVQDEIWVGTQPNHITLLGDSVCNECLGSDIFALTSEGLQGFWVSLVFTQKRARKTRSGMVAHAYNPSTLGGEGGRTA